MAHDVLLADLRSLLRGLPDERNSISPSIYDTAMVLRLAPPAQIWPAFDWLLEMQAADGGWGEADADVRARTVPTLAVVLLLAEHQQRKQTRQVLSNGLAWLQRTASAWAGPVPDDAPVGVELLLPALLDEAQRQGLSLPQAPYQELRALGAERRARIMRLSLDRLVNSTAIHSWEAFGEVADPGLVHPVNGVGCSPAATAAWLHRATADSGRAEAIAYLERAAEATGVGIPGVVPTAFPITRFVEVYTLHTLAQVGLLRHPGLHDLVAPLLDGIAGVVRGGVGCSDGFVPDGDDTAAALGALLADERQIDLAPLHRFATDDHFASYVGELQPSVITSARATQVFVAAGHDVGQFRSWIAARQALDGRWMADKWNGNWLYTTWQAILALRGDPGLHGRLREAERAILAHQYRDGGWGVHGTTPEATAYGLLALAALPRPSEQAAGAIRHGRRKLLELYRPFSLNLERHWLAKDRYTPVRLSRTIILAAIAVAESSQ